MTEPDLSATMTRFSDQPKTLVLLLEVSRLLAQSEDLNQMLGALVSLTTEQFGTERTSFFLHDAETGELYSRFAQGHQHREIRILEDSGIAGHVFKTDEAQIIHDVYKDKHFNASVDQESGFTTKNMLCVPIRTVKGEVIGVVQTLNKKAGKFTQEDLELLEAITTQAALSLQSIQSLERMTKARQIELEFLNLVSDLTSELELTPLLNKAMTEATRMLKADRSTLFINDEKTKELYSRISQGLDTIEIRLPNTAGIAGAVFTSGQSVNIPFAYADLRFNPSFDKQTGYFTRSILCVPVVNKQGKVIGVTQALNKQGGPFTDEDESRLKAFTAQIANGLENAKLFDDIQSVKNYNESMLESMSNGVVTIDKDHKIVTCNAAGLRILRAESPDIVGKPVNEYFVDGNSWIADKLIALIEEAEKENENLMDVSLEIDEESVSANVSFQPLAASDEESLGAMLLVEDISNEKRMKSTMSRYMDPRLADQLMSGTDDLLGGASKEATVLFSDIRSFTTISEQMGAQGTVAMLNEYFTLMVECIQEEGGMLDKFIGDAIMAAFGLPVSQGDDEDKALRCAIAMINELKDFNRDREAKGLHPVDIGIGLNTDMVVSGNIGSPRRMDYTLIGDGVNLGARLESACKSYFAKILISENTFRKLKGTYRIREIDSVVVKGKTEPVNIYEVLDFHDDESFPNLMEAVAYFKVGRDYYKDGVWDRAIKSFDDALKLNPNDKLAQHYIERCEILKAEPPKGKWDGIWVMKSK